MGDEDLDPIDEDLETDHLGLPEELRGVNSDDEGNSGEGKEDKSLGMVDGKTEGNDASGAMGRRTSVSYRERRNSLAGGEPQLPEIPREDDKSDEHWSVQNTLFLCRNDEWAEREAAMHEKRVKILSKQYSVISAIDALNAGELACEGNCVLIHSQATDEWFALYRNGQLEETEHLL